MRSKPENVSNQFAGDAISILNALTARIAILDGAGIIRSVNRAWQDFHKSRAPACKKLCAGKVGADYLAVWGRRGRFRFRKGPGNHRRNPGRADR